jgi:putative xylitol transport system permease protein
MSAVTNFKTLLQPAASDSGTRGLRIKHAIGDWGLGIIFLGVLIYLAVAAPGFLDIGNLTNIVLQSSIVGFVALGMTFVMITGGIDLSVGSIVGLSAVSSSLVATGSGLATIPAIALGLAVGAAVGMLNAVMVSYGAIMPFLATLATMAIARAAALVTTGGSPVSGLNPSFQWIGSGNIGPVPVAVILFALVAGAFEFLLSRTRFGRHVYAVGGNDESAAKVGISVRRIKVVVYAISGITSAIAGIVLSARVDGADPLAGTGYELQAIAAVVIGGTSLFGGVGSIRGTVLGVLLLGVVANGLNLLNVSSYYQQGVQGLIIVLAVVLNRWKSN